MALSPSLKTRQTQQLAMTPQLQQAIQMLQMSAVELHQFVASEIEINPLLDLDANSERNEGPTTRQDPQASVKQFAENEVPSIELSRDVRLDSVLKADVDYRQASSPRINNQTEYSDLAERHAGTPSLREHLSSQISLISNDPKIVSHALVLIGELDDDGYLRTPLFEIAGRLGASNVDLEFALGVLQSCEPTGIAARSLSECFALQLRESGILCNQMTDFLDRLEQTESGEVQLLKNGMDVDDGTFQKILSKIRALNPAPGRIFDNSITQYAVPDVIVNRNNLGGWSVELNQSILPTITIDSSYAGAVAQNGDKEAKYVADCTQRAQWLVKSIEQRSATILKVAAEIVRVQEEFFSLGLAYLRPLTMRDVADKLKVHESTVSRVANSKYLLCERGNFELKFFFAQAVKTARGDSSLSSVRVQEMIRKLIAQENAEKPLSDEKIVKCLIENNVNIARRTVTKYREGMNIPTSGKRKRSNSVSKN